MAKNDGVRTVGENGQISIGKEHAGKMILLTEEEEGVWKLRTCVVVPLNEYDKGFREEDETT